jgi:RIO kinase 1
MATRISEVPAIQEFLARGLITEVLRVVKAGKEATVYCCRAGRFIDADIVAAKVYSDASERSFKNSAIYQQGRMVVNRKTGKLDMRSARACRKKSRYGRRVSSAMWCGGEYETLELLHAAGADVPRPLAQGQNAILMEFIGDEENCAPQLNHMRLEPEEARKVLARVTHNIETFLGCNRVHADLSAFNILYWEGSLKIIDFPQAVDPRFNPSAYQLLVRDVDNVCSHFARYGASAPGLAGSLWSRFLRAEL